MAVLTRQPVRAAGGVLWRPVGAGVEVCVVHRPRYDDWSLPKGKLTSGEHPLTGAVREVWEETAVLGLPQVRLPSARYRMRDGVPKVVDYWSMRAVPGAVPGVGPDDEVDGVRWLTVAGAAELVSYPRDRAVLHRFAALPPVAAVLVLLRHGHAVPRREWTADDLDRPLDEAGRAQARALAVLCAPLRPERLLSASPLRCAQTLEPLAATTGTALNTDPAFDDTAHERDPRAGARRLVEVAAEATPSGSTVVSSQGSAVPRTLFALPRHPLAGRPRAPREFRTAKGTGWLLALYQGRLLAMDRLAPARGGTDTPENGEGAPTSR